jgi:tripeptide aminopeptidase
VTTVLARGFHGGSSEERERLADDFVRLCEIESPSGRERDIADAVGGELAAVGLSVEEDDSAAATGSDSGNLLARIPGPAGARTILLCAHLDTVPLAAPVEWYPRAASFETRTRRSSAPTTRRRWR